MLLVLCLVVNSTGLEPLRAIAKANAHIFRVPKMLTKLTSVLREYLALALDSQIFSDQPERLTF